MSHIVIHEDSAGTQYRQFDDLGSAVQYIEEQRNAGVETARLFEMNEIHLAVKSYFKVEVADAAPAAPAVPTPAPEAPVAEAPAADVPAADVPAADAPVAPVEVEPVPAVVADAVAEQPIDDVSYVEAAMASPIEAFATEAPPLSEYSDTADAAPSTEVRRGLFGR